MAFIAFFSLFKFCVNYAGIYFELIYLLEQECREKEVENDAKL